MNIQTAKYQVYANGEKTVHVIDTENKEYSIPMNNNNTDYQTVLLWVADGNTIEEAD